MINNNYQYYDLKLHLSDINKQDVSLIIVPYTLDESELASFGPTYRYPRVTKPGLSAQVRNYIRQRRLVEKEIQPSQGDVLFLYTEYDLLNQCVITHFKRNGARVYLIEDGGLATYLPFRMLDAESLSVREKIKQWVYRSLPSLHTLRLHKLNGHIFPWMADKFIDGVCLYRPVSIRRNIPTILVRRTVRQKTVAPTHGTVVFLNERMYQTYQNPEDYLAGLLKIMEGLCSGFDTVFFKFHPREDADWRLRITEKVLDQFLGVRIIEDDSGIEEVIESYRPSVAASYFSAGLLNLLDRGVEPLYLYHLLPDLSSQPICREASAVLLELGYNFIPEFSGANSRFQSGLMSSSHETAAISLTDLVNRK
ncbi:MAG: hypothetical protein Q8J80_05465 [Gallionella sp.]|nr:hypothetical protein [Gallionella sp.]